MTEKEYRDLILSFCASLTLGEHMGDVSNDVLAVLKRIGADKELLDVEWEDLPNTFGRLGIKTLYGTSMGED